MLREHGWSPVYTNADRIRAMDDKELAELIREEQCNAVLLQRIESVPAILKRIQERTWECLSFKKRKEGSNAK